MDDFCYKILNVYYKHEELSMNDISLLTKQNFLSSNSTTAMHWLLKNNYLVPVDASKSKDSISNTTKYKITQNGKNVVYQKKQQDKYRLFNEVRAWITLAISVIALILSIINYFF